MDIIIVVVGLFILSVILTVYACLLIFLRSWIFKQRLYKPMLLNIGLAWLPTVLIAGFLLIAFNIPNPTLGMTLIIVGLILWLLAFPNAPYLITELNFSHRKKDDPVPLYFDIIQTLTLTSTGIFVGQFGLILVHIMAILLIGSGYDSAGNLTIPGISWAIILACIFLAAFAIYLGRHVRVYSWDVIHIPAFLKRLKTHLIDKKEWKMALGYTLTYGTFMAILHVVLFGIIQVLIKTQ
jgi:uncharacterized membrane protein